MQTGLQDMGSELPSNRGKDASVAASVIDGAAAAEEGVSGSTDGRLESSADTSAPAPLSSAEKDGVALDRDVEAAVRALVDEVEVAAAENLTEGPGVKEGTGATDAGASQAASTAAGKDIESRSKVYGGAAMIAPGNRVEWAAAGLRAVQPLPQNHDFHDSGDRKRQVSPRKTIAPVGASPEVACGETGARWFATVDLALVVPSPLSLSPYAFPYGTNARAAAAADTSPPPTPSRPSPYGCPLGPRPLLECVVRRAGGGGCRARDGLRGGHAVGVRARGRRRRRAARDAGAGARTAGRVSGAAARSACGGDRRGRGRSGRCGEPQRRPARLSSSHRASIL